MVHAYTALGQPAQLPNSKFKLVGLVGASAILGALLATVFQALTTSPPAPSPIVHAAGIITDPNIQTNVPRITTLRPQANDTILSFGVNTLASPGGSFVLGFEPHGDLVLSKISHDTGKSSPVWWTDTGNPGFDRHFATLARRDSRLILSVFGHPVWEDNARLLWHSDLQAACANASATEKSPSSLTLSETGRLNIEGVCALHSPEYAEDPQERSLAIILTGLYRTNHVACKSHMKHLLSATKQFSRIDVFAYVLYDDYDFAGLGRSRDSLEAELRACYGSHIRTIEMDNIKDIAVSFPGAPESLIPPCHGHAERLYNQLHTIWLASQKWWAWSVEHGYQHDVVLRLRPDTFFHDAPSFRPIEELGKDVLVLPHPRGEHYFYCPRVDGTLGVGCSDQLAYGSVPAMQHWLDMFASFPQMVDLAGNTSRPALRDFAGCEILPWGPTTPQCNAPAGCSIECLVAWYLSARGIKFRVEWEWGQNILRWPEAAQLAEENYGT